jgi:hypothetical protein
MKLRFEKRLMSSIWWMTICCSRVAAAPFEVKIHDELIAPHMETTFETEVKLYRPPLGQKSTGNVTQSRFEVAHGLTPGSEFSVNLFTSHYDGNSQINGGKVAHIYIPEHDEGGWFHYGIKNEINSIHGMDEPSAVFYEVTPILGFHLAHWRLTLNPSVDFYFSGDRKTTFSPAVKVSYLVSGNQALGLEYYSEMGPLHHPIPYVQRSDAAYLVWDSSMQNSNLSLGVGKGVHSAGDRWVVKVVGSVPFNF